MIHLDIPTIILLAFVSTVLGYALWRVTECIIRYLDDRR